MTLRGRDRSTRVAMTVIGAVIIAVCLLWLMREQSDPLDRRRVPIDATPPSTDAMSFGMASRPFVPSPYAEPASPTGVTITLIDDLTNAPIKDVLAMSSPEPGSRGMRANPADERGRSDANGLWHVPRDCGPVILLHPMMQPYGLRDTPTRDGTLRLSPASPLTIRFRDESGSPVPGMRVVASSAGVPEAVQAEAAGLAATWLPAAGPTRVCAAISDDSGNAVMGFLRPGETYVYVRVGAYCPVEHLQIAARLPQESLVDILVAPLLVGSWRVSDTDQSKVISAVVSSFPSGVRKKTRVTGSEHLIRRQLSGLIGLEPTEPSVLIFADIASMAWPGRIPCSLEVPVQFTLDDGSVHRIGIECLTPDRVTWRRTPLSLPPTSGVAAVGYVRWIVRSDENYDLDPSEFCVLRQLGDDPRHGMPISPKKGELQRLSAGDYAIDRRSGIIRFDVPPTVSIANGASQEVVISIKQPLVMARFNISSASAGGDLPCSLSVRCGAKRISVSSPTGSIALWLPRSRCEVTARIVGHKAETIVVDASEGAVGEITRSITLE